MKWYWVLAISLAVFLLVFWISNENQKKKKKAGEGAGSNTAGSDPVSSNECGPKPRGISYMSYDCIGGNWVGTPIAEDVGSDEPYLKSGDAFMDLMCSLGDPNCNH